MDNSRNRPNDHLGVNKISRNIRKSPLHQTTFANPKQQPQSSGNGGGGSSNPQQPQPQVYNVNKSDFRSFVQQLTGTPTRDPSPAAHNPPRPPSTRLQRIRPPPLAPLDRPPAPHPNSHAQLRPVIPNPGFYPRPMPAATAPGVPFSPLLPPTPPPGSALWANTLESPISAYMRALESSILSPGVSWQAPQQMPGQPGQMEHMPPPASSADMKLNSHAAPLFPSPRGLGPPMPNPPGSLPSPTSQFPLPSPSAFLNLLSPGSSSPFPLLSPRFPMTPNFAFSPMGGQAGMLGPGPPLPPSPGPFFPPSPSGFLGMMSPRWRDS